MPPQQRERLLDFVNEGLNFGAHHYLRQECRNRSVHVSEAAVLGKRRLTDRVFFPFRVFQ